LALERSSMDREHMLEEHLSFATTPVDFALEVAKAKYQDTSRSSASRGSWRAESSSSIHRTAVIRSNGLARILGGARRSRPSTHRGRTDHLDDSEQHGLRASRSPPLGDCPSTTKKP
jgi:hypothetical protein